MHKCVKRGDLIVPGYWIYPYNYTILKENNEPIKAGDKFLFCLYDAWDYYRSFCKKNKIEYFIVDSYPGKFGNCYDTNTYNKIKNVFGTAHTQSLKLPKLIRGMFMQNCFTKRTNTAIRSTSVMF